MPYQPTNPYPYNMAVDLQEGLQFRFKVDNYDTIESFKIELYDYLKNKKLYTIVRTIGDIQFVSTFTVNNQKYNLEVNETQDKVVLTQETTILYEGAMETFKDTIKSYNNVELENQINNELDRMPNAMEDKQIIKGTSQLIQILNENEEQILLKEYTEDAKLPNSILPIKGGLGVKSIGEVDVTPYLATIEAIEMKQYYGNTENYEMLNITNEDCFVIDEVTGRIVEYREEKNNIDIHNIVIPYRTSKGNVTNIGVGVFANNENIESVVIPSCVTNIEERAFYKCQSLQEIYLNYGVSKINNYCFGECEQLYKINLLDSIAFIGKGTFQNCINLKELRLPWSLTQIEEYAFSNIGIVELELPLNLESIEANGFFGCQSLQVVNCNNKLKYIKTQAFGECVELTVINLNEQLLELGKEVFLNCEKLQEIIIPNNIQFIDSAILKGCNTLMTLKVPFIGSKKTTLEDGEFAENKKTNSVLGYFFGIKEVTEEIKEGIEETEQYYAPLGLGTNELQKQSYLVPKSLKNIIITNTTFIPFGAFSNCTNIREVEMSEEIINIQDYGFYNCIKISTIKLSPNIEYIGSYAFALEKQKTLE